MTESTPRPIRVGDNVVRDASTLDHGAIRLGDNTPTFRAGDKVVRDCAIVDHGKLRVGDWAPVCNPKK
jgi:hypothetical protein